MRRVLCLLVVVIFSMNIDAKVVPMSYVNRELDPPNDIESDGGVFEISVGDNEEIQFGPTQKRLEELYKIIMNMMIPCVNSLRTIEPLIRHHFHLMNEKVTDEEMAALFIITDSLDYIDRKKMCDGRIFGQPPLPWMI